MKYLKCICFSLLTAIILCISTNFLLIYLFKKAYEHHYIVVHVRDVGFVEIKGKKYLFVLSDIEAETQKFGTALAIGYRKNNDNELNISMFTRFPPPVDADYRFVTSPMILIPVEYFITKETVITTGEKEYPIALVKISSQNQLKVELFKEN